MNTRVFSPRTASTLGDLPRIVCCASAIEQWQWLASELSEKPRHWYFCSGRTCGIVQKVQPPMIGALRASWEAVQTVKQHRAGLLITGDPKTSFWCAVFIALQKVTVDHVAASFYLPRLPGGISYLLAQWAYSSINRLIVHSRAEKQLYGEYFGIPFARFEMQHRRAVNFELQPEIAIGASSYICALSNRQDSSTLMAAIAQLPDIPVVVITKPGQVIRAKIPPNVQIRVERSAVEVLKIIYNAQFLVLPVRSTASCDHDILVTAMSLSKTFVVPNLPSVSDYAFHDSNAVLYQPYNPDALASAIYGLWTDPAKTRTLGKNGKGFVDAFCSQEATRNYFQRLLIRQGL